ncbi:hypothetical protein F442_03335, partial [Phytophthora nicotianae P10297]
MTKDPAVKLEKLKEKVVVRTAGGHIIQAHDSVDVKLRINTAAGPVCLTKPVRCLVIDEDEEELILGKDILTTLGIDVDRQLEQLVESDITGDEDPVNCDDDLEFGVECDGEVKVAVDELVDKAIDNGFPRERRDELLKIALMFDIWRLKLGGDPPAKVPPLLIKL